MNFVKMQGIGNDYVYVDCFKENVKNPSAAARFISDRRFGIGSDGLILICLLMWQTAVWKCTIQTVHRGKCAETASAVWEVCL